MTGDIDALIAQLKANMQVPKAPKQPMSLEEVYAENSGGYTQAEWLSMHTRKGYTLGNTPPDALGLAQLERCSDEIRKFGLYLTETKPKGLVISGKAGVGKTYSACAILREVMDGMSVGLATDAELVRNAKATFSGSSTESAVIDRYCAPYLLVIDDFGKAAYNSQWTVQLVFEVLDQRLKHKKPTILTTQYNAKTLASRLTVDGDSKTAEAIISRLRFFEKIHLSCEDKRCA